MRWQEHRQKRQKDKTLHFSAFSAVNCDDLCVADSSRPQVECVRSNTPAAMRVKIYHIRRVLGGPCRYFYLFRKYLEEVEGIRFTENRGYGKTKTQMKRG